MSKLNLKAKLIGTGAINNSWIYLENVPTDDRPHAVAIGLFPKNDKRKEWKNDQISINVDGDLEYQLDVHALKDTDWEFSLINRDNSETLVEISGSTGEDPQAGSNVSIITGVIVIKNEEA
ncbi:hypothetical protein [Pedobacter sp. SYSU D00535]|uniref:hypothetical protein n=1 Tax=Pedobacter sp. SYSU D00535 TaxID=2810308 RepID=UPI001A95C4B0|nr:hypothetical protein [Pedobacter sp. SYSU D00535]